jgi:hypothetical protein
MKHVERWNAGPGSGLPDPDEKEFRPVCEAVKACLWKFGPLTGLDNGYYVLDDENTWDRTQEVEAILPHAELSLRVIESLQQALQQTNPLWRIVFCRGTGFHRETIWIYPDHYYVGILPGSCRKGETHACSQLSIDDVFRHWLHWARDDVVPVHSSPRQTWVPTLPVQGDRFQRLVEISRRWSKELVIFKTPKTDSKDRIPLRLSPYVVELRHQECWPEGMQYPEWAFSVNKVDLTDETAQVLIEESFGPFDLGTLGGMGFLRPDGSLWFFADAVNQQCHFMLTEEEKQVVEQWIPLTTASTA